MDLREYLFNLATADLLPLFPQSYFWTLQSSEIIVSSKSIREFSDEICQLAAAIIYG